MQPIPARILTHSVVLRVCSGVDVWQAPTWTETQLSKVCMQPSHETRKTRDNTEVVLRSLLFIDAVRSVPAGLDVGALQVQSEAAGQPMTLTFEGEEYTVLTVEKLFDDRGVLHHWEVGCV